MNIRIAYTITAETLNEAVHLAETRLSVFAPDVPGNEWHVTLEVTPVAETFDGHVGRWNVDVEAVRGTRYGP